MRETDIVIDEISDNPLSGVLVTANIAEAKRREKNCFSIIIRIPLVELHVCT